MKFLKENTTYYFPRHIKSFLLRTRPNVKFGVVDIKELIDKNNMLKDNSILSRRADNWGNNYSEYKFKHNIADFDAEYPIRVRESDLKVLDGNHRLIALYNDGYRKAEVILQ